MVTTSSTPIKRITRSAIATDIRGGGGFVTRTSGGGTTRTFSGGGSRSASDVQRLVEARDAARATEVSRVAEVARQARVAQARQEIIRVVGESKKAFRNRIRFREGAILLEEKQAQITRRIIARQRGGVMPRIKPVKKRAIKKSLVKEAELTNQKTSTKIFKGIKELTLGEAGKRLFAGFGAFKPIGFTSAKPIITVRKTKEVLRKKGIPRLGFPVLGLTTLPPQSKFSGAVAAELAPPESPVGLAATVGAVAIFPRIPKIPRTIISGGITALELPKAFDSEREPEQRVASGIIGGFAAVGTAAEVTPFVRGAAAQTIGRARGKFRPTKNIVVQETFTRGGQNIFLEQRAGKFTLKPGVTPFVTPAPQFRKPGTFISFEKLPGGIQVVRNIPIAGDIGLILPGSPAQTGQTSGVKLPPTSPLKKGGFGVSSADKAKFLGGPQTVTTSQRGFFTSGKDIPLTDPFFVTPQEPTLKIGETRLSRLGIENLLKIPKNPKIGFGLPPKSQIGFQTGATVTKSGAGTTFKIGAGSELEATSLQTITGVTKTGVTTIAGQGVDIFQFNVVPTKGLPTQLSFPSPKTTTGITTVSGESTTAAGTFVSNIFKTPTTSTISRTIPSSTLPPAISIGPFIPTRPTRSRGGSSLPPSPPSVPFIPPTTPRTPPSTPIVPTITPPTIRRTPPSIPIVPTITPPKTPTKERLFSGKGPKLPKLPRGRFEVLGRRLGKFKVVGVARTERGAFNIGRRFVGTTLAASFKIPKARTLKLPGFRTKKEDGGIVFIEPRKRRLKKGGKEVLEIQQFRLPKGRLRI